MLSSEVAPQKTCSPEAFQVKYAAALLVALDVLMLAGRGSAVRGYVSQMVPMRKPTLTSGI